MKVLIIGATGGTGNELIKQALAKNFTVTAFVRNPARLKIENKNGPSEIIDNIVIENIRL